MNQEIKLNGKWYVTDKETAQVLMSIVPQAIESQDFSAAQAVLTLGLMTGRIREK